MEYAGEARRCLIELDIGGMRRLHKHVWPHLPMPGSNHEMLYAMHTARLELPGLHPQQRAYSEAWLVEQRRIVSVVGIACLAASPSLRHRAANVRDAMVDAVASCIKAGLDLDKDAAEVRRRMQQARLKEHGASVASLAATWRKAKRRWFGTI